MRHTKTHLTQPHWKKGNVGLTSRLAQSHGLHKSLRRVNKNFFMYLAHEINLKCELLKKPVKAQDCMAFIPKFLAELVLFH